MRVFSKIIIVALLGLGFTAALGFYWLNYDSHDLPDINRLAQFAPTQDGKARLVCSGNEVAVVPYSELGSNVLTALEAAEAVPRSNNANNSANNTANNEANSSKEKQSESTLTLQIARTIFCEPDRELRRGVLEMRTAIQIQRHYSQDEVKAIYLNTTWFGNEIYGVSEASQYFFHKAPGELQLPEAALLVGLIRAPARYSPTQHPERALARRNEVLDEMVAAGKISQQDAATAKDNPLLPGSPVPPVVPVPPASLASPTQ